MTHDAWTIPDHISYAEDHLLRAEQVAADAGPEGHLKLAEVHLMLAKAKHYLADDERRANPVAKLAAPKAPWVAPTPRAGEQITDFHQRLVEALEAWVNL